MRSFLLTPLAVAGLAAAALAHGAPERSFRKSLSFGPVHPHAVFRTTPSDIPASFASSSAGRACPYGTAKAFVEDLLKDHLGEGYGYTIRKDSYTDKTTGVTHVYIRQLVNGLEVADGDINVNVKDGVVLSYGDSFFRGLPTSGLVSSVDPHAEYCESLMKPFSKRDQVPMGSTSSPDILDALWQSNCASRHLSASGRFSGASGAPDSHTALLNFMITATPNVALAEDLLDNYDLHLNNMRSTFESQVLGDGSQMVEHIDNVLGAVSPVKAKLAYVQVPQESGENHLALVWKFEVEMENNWYEAAVSAVEEHKIISVVDWASDAYAPLSHSAPTKKPTQPLPDFDEATYNVFAWGVNDPSVGNRTIWKEKPDVLASPAGWHSLPFGNDPQSEYLKPKEFWRNTTTTWGNNVFAHENWEGRNAWVDNYRPDAGSSLVFNYTYNPVETNSTVDSMAEAKRYINATVTQLFYTSNMVHDLYYRYGFDEVAGNFQQYNFGKGGEENDAVIANAQDGSGFNNANFMTPPDGQNGRCRMYLWNTANPYRDGDLEAGIVIHEISHGLSTRLTGGPANSGCLGWGESGGMGEGWGDFLATTIRSTKNYSDWPMGEWAANREGGIRNFPYSLDESINPSTYKTLDKPGYWGVHAIGEVWAEMLWIVSQKLIAKHGYSDTLFPPASNATTEDTNGFYKPNTTIPAHGNSLAVQLVFNGMKLQPCRPSFFDARDAIIQADQVLTGGENFCEIWAGFGKRGLGPDARVEGRTPWGGGIRTNDYSVPTVCKEEKIPEKPEDFTFII